MVRSVIYIVLMALSTTMSSQHVLEHHEAEHNGIRVAALIGHTVLKHERMDAHQFIPSWGLDIEYWFSKNWGIGLHNDIESFYVVGEEDEMERLSPMVITLDALYHLNNNFVLSGGPGVEIGEGESIYLFRVGAEYEIPIANGFDVAPTVFYDQRVDGFSTWTLGLGIGKHF